MVIVPVFKFEHCLGPFTKLPVEGYCETVLFRHLTNLVFQSSVNVLTNTLKTLHVTRRVFSNSIAFEVVKSYGKGTVVQI